MATIDKREGKTGITYRVRIRVQGFPDKIKTFKRLTDAREWAQETERSIKRGEFNNVLKESKNHTLSELIGRYKSEILPNKAPGTQHSENCFLKWWEEELGSYALSYIDSELISQKMRKLSDSGDGRQKLKKGETQKKPRSKRTLQLYRGQIDILFKHAKQWGWVASNPVDGVNKITKINNARVRFLDDNEREALLKACEESPNSLLYPIVIFALSTGARLGEITKLTLKDIDLKREVAILRDTKNGETRSIPIVQKLKEILTEHIKTLDRFYKDRNVKIKWLFPRRDGLKPIDIRKAWTNARDEAEIEDFRFHDLRHSAASYLAMNGATLLEIAAVLGHKTLQMVKRYSHLSENHTKSIVEKMNKKIF